MTRKEIEALICNIVLVVLGIIGVALVLQRGGLVAFKYYTFDSNLLALISSVLYVIFMIVKKDQTQIPYFVMVLRYLGTISLMVTLTVVVLYLAPFGNYVEGGYFNNLGFLLFTGDMLYQHLLCPLISFLSFASFEGDRRLNKKKTVFLAMLPTLVYGVIMLVLNILSIENGPYPFFRIKEEPLFYSIVVVAILLATYVMGRFVLLLNQKNAPRRPRRS